MTETQGAWAIIILVLIAVDVAGIFRQVKKMARLMERADMRAKGMGDPGD